MIIHGLSTLEEELEGTFGDEPVLTLEIDGSDVGTPGWIPALELHLRDRIVVSLLTDAPTGLKWTQSQMGEWKKGWQAIFTSLGTLPPDVDPDAFRLLFNAQRHVSLVTDTSAIAGGVIAWIARCKWNATVEVAMPSVVERELFGWSDQDGFWERKPEHWSGRVQYRLARRVSETPLENVLVRRPAIDEKAALMLSKAKLKPGEKSPDADVLLIELARDYQRIQPSDAHVFYVTGDRNHARSAVGILGHAHVLFAPSAPVNLQSHIGLAAFWQPSRSLGAMCRLGLSNFVWDLMAGCNALKVRSEKVEGEVRLLTHGIGCPSDWKSPTFELIISRDTRGPATIAGPTGPIATLLSPPLPESPISGPVTIPSAAAVEAMLNSVLAGQRVEPMKAGESARFLAQAGVLTDDGEPIPESRFMSALRRSDWDAVHAELHRVPGYGRAFGKLGPEGPKLTSRDEAHVNIARRLGQAARIRAAEPLLIGSAALTRLQLIEFLESVLAEIGRDYAVADVLSAALRDLQVSPARFERAMLALLSTGYNQVTFETGGTVEQGWAEKIWTLAENRLEVAAVGAGALYFGGDRPIRKLRRHG